EREVEPRGLPSRSRIMTPWPASWAASAAVSPHAPAPITTTGISKSKSTPSAERIAIFTLLSVDGKAQNALSQMPSVAGAALQRRAVALFQLLDFRHPRRVEELLEAHDVGG